MNLSQKEIKAFQKEILEWYALNKRDLPWRVPDGTLFKRDPYKILVSEVMAQQTQLSRVVPKYVEWMKKFPTLQSLATASTRDVLRYWSGLGYNRRALYLRDTAKILVKRKPSPQPSPKKGEGDQGEVKISWPRTEGELRKLPGIGEYTARAILCFAFNKQVAVVDTNVKKVIMTFFKGTKVPNETNETKVVREIAEMLLPKGKAYEWNQALMDYAAAVLKKEKILIPKQSHFKTSNRFYRGQVIRLLLKKQETVGSLFSQIENNGVSEGQFEKILRQMGKEGLVDIRGKRISLP